MFGRLTVQNLTNDDKMPPLLLESRLSGAIVVSHRLRMALKAFHSMAIV